MIFCIFPYNLKIDIQSGSVFAKTNLYRLPYELCFYSGLLILRYCNIDNTIANTCLIVLALLQYFFGPVLNFVLQYFKLQFLQCLIAILFVSLLTTHRMTALHAC